MYLRRDKTHFMTNLKFKSINNYNLNFGIREINKINENKENEAELKTLFMILYKYIH